MIPLPLSSSFRKSSRSSAGSPKKWSPPWARSWSSERWIAPTLRSSTTLPYSSVSSSARSPQCNQHRLQIVEVEEHQPLLVGDVECDRQHAFLDIVEVHQAGEQQRAHFADGGADRMTLLAEQVPELDRKACIGPAGVADIGGAGGKGFVRFGGRRAGHGEAGEIALHVGDEGRNACAGQSFDDALQRDRLAGAGRSGDQAVAVGALELELLRLRAARAGADEDAGRGLACHRVASLLRPMSART